MSRNLGSETIDSLAWEISDIERDAAVCVADRQLEDTWKGQRNDCNNLYYCVDDALIYTAFFADFGPLDLGLTYKFCSELVALVNDAEKSNKLVYFYSSKHQHRRANAAVLICAYQIFVLKRTGEEAYSPFIGINPPFIPFRDAAFCINTYPITVLDCAKAMYKAVYNCHFDFATYNLLKFQHMAKLQHGDLSWIVPNKFLAFSGPVTKKRQISPGVETMSPEEYVPVLKELGVTVIVRFNSKCYDRTVFTRAGIKHVELFYEDGGNPTEQILQSFLSLGETEKGAIAVHCKAGLGRTGTNIAAYMVKHYNYSVNEAIAWHRICRPGSVVGPQQQYLASIESRLVEAGIDYRNKLAKPCYSPVTLGTTSTSSSSLSTSTESERDRSTSLTPPLQKMMNFSPVKESKSLFRSIVTKKKDESDVMTTPPDSDDASSQSSHGSGGFLSSLTPPFGNNRKTIDNTSSGETKQPIKNFLVSLTPPFGNNRKTISKDEGVSTVTATLVSTLGALTGLSAAPSNPVDKV